jgi:hypothetical protein
MFAEMFDKAQNGEEWGGVLNSLFKYLENEMDKEEE